MALACFLGAWWYTGGCNTRTQDQQTQRVTPLLPVALKKLSNIMRQAEKTQSIDLILMKLILKQGCLFLNRHGHFHNKFLTKPASPPICNCRPPQTLSLSLPHILRQIHVSQTFLPRKRIKIWRLLAELTVLQSPVDCHIFAIKCEWGIEASKEGRAFWTLLKENKHGK